MRVTACHRCMALAECRHDAHSRPVCVACNEAERAWWADECDDVDETREPDA